MIINMYMMILLYYAQIHDDNDGNDDSDKDEETELCCICFERTCTIAVQDCGHQMCAGCTLAFCCHNKPNPAMPNSPAPACPFCRRNIVQLKPAQLHKDSEWLVQGDTNDRDPVCESKLKKSMEGSSSNFIGFVGRGSLRLLTTATRGSACVLDVDAIKECSSQQEMYTL